MEKPSLVIMAAGMGSRYGGLKQLDPFDAYGNFIIDYSCFDAIRAGFGKIVFIIKRAIYDEFVATIGKRVSKYTEVAYVLQELDKLPAGFSVPDGRVKPWGTSHALLCAAEEVRGGFAVIGADDYFGTESFRVIYDFLVTDADPNSYAMVGYDVANTMPSHGFVARGVCSVDGNNMLTDIVERKRIRASALGAEYTEDGVSFVTVPKGTTVSMNFFGFKPSIFDVLEEGFPRFLQRNLPIDPLKCEDLLPDAVRRAISSGKYSVKALRTPDRWYGVTNKEDKQPVVDALRAFTQSGLYPEGLWR